MKSNIVKYINYLEGFKTAIKNQHWSSVNLSEHKLWDDIATSVSDIQDSVSEISQGLYGQFKKNELKPIPYKINNQIKFLNDLLNVTKKFYSTIQDNDDFIGIRSEIENFIGEISKYMYLMKLAIKQINENKLRSIIRENINKVLNGKLK